MLMSGKIVFSSFSSLIIEMCFHFNLELEDNPEVFSNLTSNIILCENTSIISVGDWTVV